MANNNDLKAIEEERETAIEQSNSRYDEMIGSVEQKYDALQEQVTQNADQQAQIQQDRTDLALKQLEQQKEKAEKEHVKEQSNAYTDWQKQSAAYGANAEAMASMGLKGTGYAESSQVRMYTAYQSRVASAKASLDAAILSYNNGMDEAKLQNSAALAQIYAQANQQRLELALQGFQYQNQLIQEKANQELQLKSYYDSKWQNALSQITREKELALQAERDKRNYELELLKLQQEGYDDGLKINGDGPYLELNRDKRPTELDGHGKLAETADEVEFQIKDSNGKTQTVTETLFRAADGTLWYWDDRQKKYVQFLAGNASSTSNNSQVASPSTDQKVGKHTAIPGGGTQVAHADSVPIQLLIPAKWR